MTDKPTGSLTGSSYPLAGYSAASELDVAHDKIVDLQHALVSTRAVGVAIGVAMERWHVTAEQALSLLTRISQNTDRPLPDLATEIVSTGNLPGAD